MKLHLPTRLRAAVLACVTAVAALASTVGTGTLTAGAVAYTVAASQAYAGYNADTHTFEGADNNNFQQNFPNPATDITFNMENTGTGNWFNGATYAGNVIIGADGATDKGLCINNGNQYQVLTLSGKVTGTGLISKKGSGTDVGLAFTGDVTQFTGAIVLDSDRGFTLRFGTGGEAAATTATQGASGTGDITFMTNANSTLIYNYAASANPVYVTNAIVRDGNATSKVTFAGAAHYTVTKAAEISTLALTDTASVTFNGTTTLVTVTGAAGTSITNAGALTLNGTIDVAAAIVNNGTVTLGNNFKIDLTHMTAAEGVYTIFSGTAVDLSSLTKANLLGTQAGYTYTFGTDGTITAANNAKTLTWTGGDLTWTVGATIGESTFAEGDGVQFTTANAAVTLGEDITSFAVSIAEGIEVSFSGAHSLTADAINLSGTMVLQGGVSLGAGTVIHNEGTAAEVKLIGVEMTAGGLFAGYSGAIVIGNGGTLKMSGDRSLGAWENSITVEAGGTLDINGSPNHEYVVTLNGGSLLNNGNNVGTNAKQIKSLAVTADSTIGGTGHFGIVAPSYADNTVTLNDHKLTKTGDNILYMSNTTVSGGTLRIEAGEVNQYKENGHLNCDIEMAGGSLTGRAAMEDGHTISAEGTGSTIGCALTVAGGVTVDTAAEAALNVTGVLTSENITKTGAGSLTLAAGSTATVAAQVNGGSLTLNGANSLAAVSVASGATLNVADATALGGSLTLAGGATLSSTTADSAMSVTGLTLSKGAKLDITNAAAGYSSPIKLLSGLTEETISGLLFVEDGGVKYANIVGLVTVTGVSADYKSVSLVDGTLSLVAHTAPVVELAWLGDGGTWNDASAEWTKEGISTPVAYAPAAKVTIGGTGAPGGTITVSGEQTATSVTFASNNYVLNAANGASLTIAGDLTVNKNVSATMGFLPTLGESSKIVVNEGATLDMSTVGMSADLLGTVAGKATGEGTVKLKGGGGVNLYSSLSFSANVQVEGGLWVNGKGTASTITIEEDSTFTVKGELEVGYSSGVDVNGGSLEAQGGFAIGHVSADKGTLTMSGGSVTTSYFRVLNGSNDNEITITGGTLTLTGETAFLAADQTPLTSENATTVSISNATLTNGTTDMAFNHASTLTGATVTAQTGTTITMTDATIAEASALTANGTVALAGTTAISGATTLTSNGSLTIAKLSAGAKTALTIDGEGSTTIDAVTGALDSLVVNADTEIAAVTVTSVSGEGALTQKTGTEMTLVGEASLSGSVSIGNATVGTDEAAGSLTKTGEDTVTTGDLTGHDSALTVSEGTLVTGALSGFSSVTLGAGAALTTTGAADISKLVLSGVSETPALTLNSLTSAAMEVDVLTDTLDAYFDRTATSSVTVASLGSATAASLTLAHTESAGYVYSIAQNGTDIVIARNFSGIVWNGGQSSEWGSGEGTDWQGGKAPTDSDDVSFVGNEGSSDVTIVDKGVGANAVSVTGKGAQSADYTFSGGSLEADSLAVDNGSLTIKNESSFVSGVVKETGSLTVDDETASLKFDTLTVKGTLAVEKGVLLLNDTLTTEEGADIAFNGGVITIETAETGSDTIVIAEPADVKVTTLNGEETTVQLAGTLNVVEGDIKKIEGIADGGDTVYGNLTVGEIKAKALVTTEVTLAEASDVNDLTVTGTGKLHALDSLTVHGHAALDGDVAVGKNIAITSLALGDDATLTVGGTAKVDSIVSTGGSIKADSLDLSDLTAPASVASIMADHITLTDFGMLTVTDSLTNEVGGPGCATVTLNLDDDTLHALVAGDVKTIVNTTDEWEFANFSDIKADLRALGLKAVMVTVDGVSLLKVEDNSFFAQLGATENGKAGLTMADDADAAGVEKTGDLAAILAHLDNLREAGTPAAIEAGDKIGAALSGASVAAMGAALSGDVERQLKAIRNRTTVMGVNQAVVNEDMPYLNAWVNAEGDYRDISEDGTMPGYKMTGWGGTVGFDVDCTPSFTCGLAATAMYGDFTSSGDDNAEGELNTYYVSAFARYAKHRWTHTFVATAGMADTSLDRTVDGVKVTGDSEGTMFGGMYEVGYVFALDKEATTCLQPIVNVSYMHTTLNGYEERGSDIALKTGDVEMNKFTVGVGARLQSVIGENIYNRSSLFEARALVKFDAGDRQGEVTNSFVKYAGSANAKSVETGAVGGEFGMGVTVPVGGEGGNIFMDASAEIRADYVNVNGTVGYRVNF